MPRTLRGAAHENLLEFGDYSPHPREVAAQTVRPQFAASLSIARQALESALNPLARALLKFFDSGGYQV